MYGDMAVHPDDICEDIQALIEEGFHFPTSEEIQPLSLTFNEDEEVAGLESVEAETGEDKENTGSANSSSDRSANALVAAGAAPDSSTAKAPSKKRSREEKSAEIQALGEEISARQPAEQPAAQPLSEGGAPLPPFAGTRDAPEVHGPAAPAKVDKPSKRARNSTSSKTKTSNKKAAAKVDSSKKTATGQARATSNPKNVAHGPHSNKCLP
jgi:hypothetical protein